MGENDSINTSSKIDKIISLESQERQDIPQDVRDEIAGLRNKNSLLEKKISFLMAQNQKLKELLEIHKKEKRRTEDRIFLNPVTGLPNHYRMKQELPFILRKAEEGKKLCVYIIKLDKSFSMLTKTLKPSMTEWILYQTGMRIGHMVGKGNYIYHTREDEFIAIIKGQNTTEDIKNFAVQLSEHIKRPHIFSGYHIATGAHIGIAIYPDHSFNSRTLLHNADIALEHCIETKNSFSIFTEDMRKKVVERMDIHQFLLKSLESQAIMEIKKQFELFFQPIIALRKNHRDRWIISHIDAEALIRWHHPEKGLLLPGQFIPIAEETGIISLLGTWVLYAAADTLNEWKKLGLAKPNISINLSPVQFNNTDIKETIEKISQSRNIDTEHITLEITENVVMTDPISSIKKMKEIRQMGVHFSLDDFGTGYSSLNYIKTFPFSVLKIDRSFIKDMESNQYDRAIVKSIISLAKELSLKTIAEGVETPRQLNFLLEEGCTNIQGYIFSKPRDSHSFLHFVQNFLGKEISEIE